jgi:hypothetical protein
MSPTTALGFVAFCYFTVRLLAEYLLGIELVVATVYVCLCPAVWHFARAGDSIIQALAAFVGFIFYLKRSEFFKNRRSCIWAALWLGVGACIRPVETLSTAGLFGVRYFFRAKQLNQVSRNDGILCLVCLILGGLATYAGHPLFALPILFPGFLFRNKLALSRNFWLFIGLAYVIAELGLARGSAGDVTRAAQLHHSGSPWEFFFLMADFFSWPLFAAALAIALLRMKAVARYWRMALMFVPALLVPAVFGAYFQSAEFRYYLPAVILAYQAAAVMALQRDGGNRWLRIVLMAGVVTVSVVEFHS